MTFIVPSDPLKPKSISIRPDPALRVVAAEDYQAWQQASDMLQTAQAQAEAILANAKQGYEQECRRGYEEGVEQARLAQTEKMIETVGKTVDYLARVEGEIVTLVMDAIRKITHSFDEQEKVLLVVRNALSIMRNQKQVTLRLHPQDLQGLRTRVNALLVDFPAIGYIDLVSDERLQLGSCILESELGMIEASMEGQIEAMRSAFQRVLGSRI